MSRLANLQKMDLVKTELAMIKELTSWMKSPKIDVNIFIGPWSDHSLPMSLTDSLTHWLTDELVEDWMNWPKYADYADKADYAE